MDKPDFPALLPAGMHSMTLERFHEVTVAPFPQDERRRDLHERFTAWISALRAAGVSGTLWIDGSFLTEKPCPGDIDCVFWYPKWVDEGSVTPETELQVSQILGHDLAKALFNLDLYVEIPVNNQLFHRQAYWRGVFGFCHDMHTAKGIAEVKI